MSNTDPHFEKESFSDRMHTYSIFQNVHVSKDKTLSIGYQLLPLSQIGTSATGFKMISSTIFDMMKALPENVTVKFVYDRTKRSYKDLINFDVSDSSDLSDYEISLENSVELQYFKRDKYRSNMIKSYFDTDIYVFFEFPHEENDDSKRPDQSFFIRPKYIEQFAHKEFTERKKNIELFAKTFEESFGQLSPIRLNNSQLLMFLHRFYNLDPNFNRSLKVRSEFLNDDLIEEAYSHSNADFSIGNNHVSVISLKDIPNKVVTPIIDASGFLISPIESLMNMDFESMTFLQYTKLPEEKSLSHLKSIKKVNEKFKSNIAKESVKEIDGPDGLYKHIEMGKDIGGFFSLNVVLYHHEKDVLKENRDYCKAQIRRINDASILVENEQALNVFMSLPIGNGHHNPRKSFFRGTTYALLCNVTGSYRGAKRGVLLQTISAKPFYYDTFNSPTGYNGFFIGPTGSGKSFTMNYWLHNYLEEGTRIAVLDMGGSYRYLTRIFGGNYVEIGDKNPSYIDPIFYFDLSKNVELKNENLRFIVNFLEMMLIDGEQKSLSKNDKNDLFKSVQDYFESTKSDKFHDIHKYFDFIKNNADLWGYNLETRTKFINTINLYINQLLIDYFDPKNENRFDLDSNFPIITFDISSLKNNKELTDLIGFLIQRIVNDMARKDLKRFIFVIDEAWAFLEASDAITDSVILAYRTYRKSNAAMFLISQSIADIQSEKLEAAILTNSSTKVILQHLTGQDLVVDTLHLNSAEERAFRNTGKFQMFITAQNIVTGEKQPVVAKTLHSKAGKWIYTSHPDEKPIREEVEKECKGDLIRTFDILSSEYS